MVNSIFENLVADSFNESIDRFADGVKNVWSFAKRFSPSNIVNSMNDDTSHTFEHYKVSPEDDMQVKFNIVDSDGRIVSSLSIDTNHQSLFLENGEINYHEIQNGVTKSSYRDDKHIDKLKYFISIIKDFNYLKRFGSIEMVIESDSLDTETGDRIHGVSKELDIDTFYETLMHADSRTKQNNSMLKALVVAAVIGGGYLAFNNGIPSVYAAAGWHTAVSAPAQAILANSKNMADAPLLGQVVSPVMEGLKFLSKGAAYAVSSVIALRFVNTGKFVLNSSTQRDEAIQEFKDIHRRNIELENDMELSMG